MKPTCEIEQLGFWALALPLGGEAGGAPFYKGVGEKRYPNAIPMYYLARGPRLRFRAYSSFLPP